MNIDFDSFGMMRTPAITLVDAEYPSQELLEMCGQETAPISSSFAAEDAVPIAIVERDTLLEIAEQVAADYFAPYIDGQASMAEISVVSGMAIDIVRGAIRRLVTRGVVTLAMPVSR